MATAKIATPYKKLLSKETGFYRKYYAYFFVSLMLLLLSLMVATSFLIYQLEHLPLPSFFATNIAGQKLALTPFEEPNLLPDTILRWASKGATIAYTFDFVNYNKQVAAARPYFTDAGWKDYLSSVDVLITNIVQNQLFVNGVVSGPPLISNQGPLPGTEYAWRVQIPFLVTYQSANSSSKRNYMVVLTVVRVPTHINPQGIGIDQFVMRSL